MIQPVMPPRSSQTSVLDLLIEIMLLALLAFLPAAFGGVYVSQQLIAYTIAAAIALLLSIRSILHPPTFARLWIWIPPALFILIAAIQLIALPAGAIEFLSPHTARMKTDFLDDLPDAAGTLSRMALSFYSLATRDDLRVVLLATTVLWCVIVIYRDILRIKRLLWAITLIGGALALLALLQDITHTDKVYWRVLIHEPAKSGTFVNHSHYSQFMNLSIGAALALLLLHLNREPDADRSNLRTMLDVIVPAAVIVVGLATISLSLSRGGMVAIVGAGLFTMLALLSIRQLRWLGGVVALLGVFASLGLALYGIERVEKRLREHGGIDVRFQMINDSWGMSKQFPLTGIGLGTFEWVYTMYDRTGTPSTASHVENEYVQALVEMGWPGLLLVIAMIVVVAWHWLRALRSPDGMIAAAAAGLSYGLVAVMLHSLTDFGQHLPANACLSATLCGLLINLGSSPRDDQTIVRSSHRAVVAAVATLVCIVALWVVIEAWYAARADRHWQAAQQVARRLERNDWEGTREQYDRLIAHAQRAIDAQPGSAYYRYWTALYRWRQSRRTREDDDPQLLPEARQVVAELHEARRLCPTYGPIYSVLGQIEHTHLSLPIGITHIHTAARLEPNDANIIFIAGRSDARRAKYDSALEKFRRAVTLDAVLMDDVIELYLNELARPELAMQVADTDYHRMLQVSDALKENPKYQALGHKAYLRAIDILEEKCQAPDASGWDLATLASNRAGLGDHAAAEKYYTRALQQDYTNLAWRMQRAESLHALGRITEAIEEAKRAARQHPESPDAKRVLEQVSKPIAPQ